MRLFLLTLALLPQALPTAAQPRPANGPLRVLASNPRWLADPSGKAVLLTGTHVWWNMQDNGLIIRGAKGNPPPVFDYAGYLDFLNRFNHNFFRLWRWETTRWTDTFTKELKYATPHPWARTGPGNAVDGAPRFDLTRFNDDYFARLRSRVIAARDRGIYVSVMLFDGWEIQFTDAWQCHPFHEPNNVNGVEADADGNGFALEYNTLHRSGMGRKVQALQEAYVRNVIDTVNDLDNVLYEISNEAHGGSTEWQYYLIRFIRDYESRKPKQHPIGMTFQYKGGTNAILNESPADWISPNPGDGPGNYRTEPCANCSPKVVVSDTDHLWGHTGADNVWVWKTFLRGLNVLFMEDYLPSPTWQDSARTAMGQVRRFAEKVNLAEMRPADRLSETRYCLAEEGRQYLVFQHDKGEFTVDLKDAPGTFQAEWFDVNGNRAVPAKPVQGGASRTFTTPFPGPAVLYLRKTN